MAEKCHFSSENIVTSNRVENSNTADLPAEWSCSKPAVEGYNRCLYHLSGDERDSEGIDKETVSENIEETIVSGDQRSSFIGAKLPELDLSELVITGPKGDFLDLRFAEIDGSLDFSNSIVELPIRATDLSIGSGGLDITNTVFKDTISFHCSSIQGSTNGTGVHFQGDAVFSRIDSSYSLNLKDGATFDQKAVFSNSHIHSGALNTRRAVFRDSFFARKITAPKINCEQTTFRGFVGMNGAEIKGECNFSKSHFHSLAAFGESDIHSSRRSTEILGLANFSEVIADRLLSLDKVQFRSGVTMRGGSFDNGVSLELISLHEHADFSDSQISKYLRLIPQYVKSETDDQVDITADSAIIERGVMSQPGRDDCDRVVYDFSNSTIGDLKFKRANLEGVPYKIENYKFRNSSLEDVHFENTRFEGFDFTSYRHQLEDDWIIDSTDSNSSSERGLMNRKIDDDSQHRHADLEPRREELTYMYAKRGANEIGDNRAASQFFIKEMDARMRRYKTRVADGMSIWERRKDVVKYAFYRGWKTVNYSESPGRVFGLSVLSLLSFTLLYLALGTALPAEVPYSGTTPVLGALVFSVESFITLVHPPGANVDSTWIRLASVAEGFSGAFLISLFVFSLTRGVYR